MRQADTPQSVSPTIIFREEALATFTIMVPGAGHHRGSREKGTSAPDWVPLLNMPKSCKEVLECIECAISICVYWSSQVNNQCFRVINLSPVVHTSPERMSKRICTTVMVSDKTTNHAQVELKMKALFFSTRPLDGQGASTPSLALTTSTKPTNGRAAGRHSEQTLENRAAERHTEQTLGNCLLFYRKRRAK